MAEVDDGIWDWVHRYIWDLRLSDDPERRRMAEALIDFTSAAGQKEAAVVEAAYPELLAFVRGEQNAWAEVFVRHWRLQAYVHTPADPRALTVEALDLVQFAHGEAARDCPQRVCAIDDLNALYGQIDAVGYAEERLNLVSELLETTPTHFGCFMCLAVGKRDILVDLGRPEEAIECWRASLERSELLAATVAEADHYLEYWAWGLGEAHLRAGRPDEALAVLETCQAPKAYHRFTIDALSAEALLALGRRDAALARFKTALEVEDDALDATQAARLIAAMRAAGLVEGAEARPLAERLLDVAALAGGRGRVREAFDAAREAFELAETSGAEALMRRALAAMAERLPELRAPVGADAAHAEAAARMGG